MKVTKGPPLLAGSAGLAIMTTLSLSLKLVTQSSSALVVDVFTGGVPVVLTKIGLSCPFICDGVFTAPVVASITQTFPGLSPTQTSVLLLSVNTPSGPEKSFPPGLTPANPGLGNGVTAPGCCVASTTSIALLLRSAKKNFLSFGSNQLMSNEKRFAPGTCKTVVTWNTSSFLKTSSPLFGPSGWLKAGTATASMAMAPIPTPAASLFFDGNL